MNPSKNNYEKQLALIQGDNINVSKTSDIKSFFILVAGVVAIVWIVFFIADFFTGIYISNMPDKRQIEIENILKKPKLPLTSQKYSAKLEKLDRLKQKIINADKRLQNKSEFSINAIEHKDVNAGIMMDGSIFFTTAALDAGFSEQEYAFILAHELGHYLHRDHLRTISRELVVYSISSLFGASGDAGKFIGGISAIQGQTYSRKQERKADFYAGEMLKKIYGTNQGGISFIHKIKANEKNPEFLYYLSSHPSWNDRLKLLENQNK